MLSLFYNAKTKSIRAMNGSGRYPANATLEQIKTDWNLPGQTESIPKTSASSVTTPGVATGWVDTVERFGSGKLSLEHILAPAIELAEEGFPVSELSCSFWRDHEPLLRSASPNFKELLKAEPSAKEGVRSPSAGEIMKNPTLAQTFRALVADGKKGFYEGRVAEELVKVVQDLGGY
ncbi:gamma-glutamyltranspeptidase [Aspergillus lucknowensis]|uniref:Gamma-glutamyltranspeptidase n=1 Tax=Aspergillus lucknowensis TaxID=176173 RepID=A0ABR4M4C3_9EURO